MSCLGRIHQFPRNFLHWQAPGCVQVYSFKSMFRILFCLPFQSCPLFAIARTLKSTLFQGSTRFSKTTFNLKTVVSEPNCKYTITFHQTSCHSPKCRSTKCRGARAAVDKIDYIEIVSLANSLKTFFGATQTMLK